MIHLEPVLAQAAQYIFFSKGSNSNLNRAHPSRRYSAEYSFTLRMINPLRRFDSGHSLEF